MKKLIFTGILYMAASAFLCLNAQDAKPKTPLVPRTPPFATWTVRIQYQDEEKKTPADAPPDLATRQRAGTVTKTNEIYREEVTLASGKKYEKWAVDGTQWMIPPTGNALIPISPPSSNNSSSDYRDYSQSDFPELSWISLSNFKGVSSYEGREAFRFETPTKKAFLSTGTQLPLYLKDEEATRLYTYGTAPSAPLVPPEKILKAIKKWKAWLRAQSFNGVPL